MKNLIFTIIATILFTTTIAATSLVAPMDTINKKSTTCIFEMNDESVNLSQLISDEEVVDLGEEFIEETSKPSNIILKPVPKNFTGFKVEVTKVYNEPLEYSNMIFSIYDSIMIERIRENQFAYLTGEFKTAKEATAFIAKQTANKKLVSVEYKNGVRVN